MTLIFNPDTGLVAPETSEIRDALALNWQNAFFETDKAALDTDSSTPAGQLIDAETAEIEAKNADFLFLASQFNPRLAEGRWQDALGYIYFLTRKVAEPTIVTCQVTGLMGTVIPYGAIVQNIDGHRLICNSSITIDSTGNAETTFRVITNGAIDIPANSVTTITTVIAGWDTVNNHAAGAIGRDVETRAEFENRRYASVAANSHGSASALYGAIANIGGVLDLAVLENVGPDPIVNFDVTIPGHGVTICVYGGEDADIAETIYNKKNAGSATGGNTTVTHIATDFNNIVYEYLILRPETVNFWVRVTLGGVPSESVKENILTAIYQDFLGQNQHTQTARVGLAQTVYASRFYHAIMAVDGVTNLANVEIALTNDAIPTIFSNVLTIAGDIEPVISRDNIIITVV